MKVLVSTSPFGAIDRRPRELLEAAGISYTVNTYGRKMREDELAELIPDIDVLIAGTEQISNVVLTKANKLRLICRVGIGLDSVDLIEAERKGVRVSYTPDAPSAAVVDLTLGMMFSLMRSTHLANLKMHEGQWTRFFGKRLVESTIGIIGVGRIGSKVTDSLVNLGCKEILLHDLERKAAWQNKENVTWASKDQILGMADLVSVHVPRTVDTVGMIGAREIALMKDDSFLVNTARGGIVDEDALAEALIGNKLAGAAVDVFESEPYSGKLTEIDQCFLTSHMGSMSLDCRARMEIEATEEAERWIKGAALRQPVPEFEYEMRRVEQRESNKHG
jgi:D-3-phosphoglycerate dehydrogenase / 2-oxoglutarate reductase